MALFKKNEPQPAKPRDRPSGPGRPQGDAAISIIGSGMSVVGDISTEGTVRVEGQVRGTIRAGTAVVLGQNGVIEGNVLTQDAVIGGTVSGSVVASNRLELQATCSVEGEISTRAEHLKLEEGARFAGQVQMIEEKREEPAPLSPASDEYGHGSSDDDQAGVFESALADDEEDHEDVEDEGGEEDEESGSGRKKAEAR